MKNTIQNFLAKLQSQFNKPKIIVVIVVVLALSLPFVINQVLQQQDIRQRATVAPPVTVALGPSKTLTIGETFDVDVTIATDVNDIGAAVITAKYDPSFFEFETPVVPGPLELIHSEQNIGEIKVTVVNKKDTPITASNAKIITFKVKALKAGSSTITIDNSMKATAKGSGLYITVSNADLIKADYTIVEDCTTLEAGRPTSCFCTTDNQCTSNDCRLKLETDSPLPGATTSDKICWPQAPTATPTVTETLIPSPTPTLISDPTNTPTPTPISDPTNTPTPTDIPPNPNPTATNVPTATIAPGETTLKLSVRLPGIGSGPVNLGLNSTPVHPQRTSTVQLISANGQIAKTVSTIMTYQTPGPDYTGSFALGTSFTSGPYTVKIRFDNSLYKAYPVIIQIITGQKQDSDILTAHLVTGDINQDNVLSIEDYNLVVACYQGAAACTNDIKPLADVNDNAITKDDLDDFAILQRGFTIRNGD